MSEVRRVRIPGTVNLRALGLGALAGVIAGMTMFAYFSADLLPAPVRRVHLLILLVAVGGLVHPIARDLDESITAAVVASFFGFGVHILAYVSPAYLLDFPPITRTILVPRLAGEATSTALLIYFMAFYSGYFTVVTIDGLFYS